MRIKDYEKTGRLLSLTLSSAAEERESDTRVRVRTRTRHVLTRRPLIGGRAGRSATSPAAEQGHRPVGANRKILFKNS